MAQPPSSSHSHSSSHSASDHPSKDFLRLGKNPYNLITYKKSRSIYLITRYFVRIALKRGDRTIDQMVQAARSGKQNIIEGAKAGPTSRESEIRLTNVAKASLQELREDFLDWLRINEAEIWQDGTEIYSKARRVCGKHNDEAYYKACIANRTPANIANIAVVLIDQTDALLYKQLLRLQKDFLRFGGIREAMSVARRAVRGH